MREPCQVVDQLEDILDDVTEEENRQYKEVLDVASACYNCLLIRSSASNVQGIVVEAGVEDVRTVAIGVDEEAGVFVHELLIPPIIPLFNGLPKLGCPDNGWTLVG